MDEEDTAGVTLLSQVRDFVSSFLKVGELIPRLAAHSNKENYQEDLKTTPELVELFEELDYKVQSASAKATEYKDAFMVDYSHLWEDDRSEFLRQFLLYNHVPTAEELEKHNEEHEGEPFPESPPTLEQFKESIDKYNGIAT